MRNRRNRYKTGFFLIVLFQLLGRNLYNCIYDLIIINQKLSDLKKYIVLVLVVLSTSISGTHLKAQRESVLHKCATDEMMHQIFQNDPAARARYENTQRLFASRLNTILNNQTNKTQAVVTIPVVVHIGLPDPTLVTDATVQSQLDTLNFYYGTQPIGDSLRVYTPFRAAYGRTEIRFCLAQRTPTDLPTTGINRTVNSIIYTTTHPSDDLGAWDPTKYLNIWVVRLGGGVLGYSFLPGTFAPNDPRNGFVNDYRAFGAGAAYLYPSYNLGKTAVHEIGHFFNLNHPWSDASNASSNPGCTLSDGCADTPPSAGPTFNCPSSPVIDACSGLPNGVMFQNHMDYADDACMLLFTTNQCTRMNASVTLADRVGLTVSNGCQPVLIGLNNAGISAILQPVNNLTTACTSVPLSVTLRNFGSNNLTSAVINILLDGNLIAAQNFNGNLAPNTTTNISLSNLNIASLGAHVIKVHTTLPNGVPDTSPANDTSTVNITKIATVSLPIIENFEGASFPSTGWSANNPDAPASIPGQVGFGWERGAFTSPSGTRSGRIDFFNYSTDQAKDSLISPDIDMTTPVGPKQISFDRAHASFRYPPIAPNIDTLEILVSTNCGASYTSVWKKYGAIISDPNSLNTVTTNTTAQYIPTATSEWLNEVVDISSAVGASPIARVMFKSINRYGNDLYIDNINITGQFKRDLGVIAITSPLTNECINTITPQVTVKNFGSEVVNTFTIEYTVDGANPLQTNVATPLASGATTTITLLTSGILTTGNHVFRATTLNPAGPSGAGDQNTGNDAQTKNILIRNITNAPPPVETFEGPVFPSVNWTIINPNGNNTWVKKDQGYLSNNSAFIDNYNFNTFDQTDELQTPVFKTTGNGGVLADSLIITWDLAARYYPLAPYDTFTVRTSADCGNSFSNVLFNAGGPIVGSPEVNDFLVPIESDWKRNRAAIGGAPISSGTQLVGFRNKNEYGNNMFLDNINVSLLFKRDLELVLINKPEAVCSGNFTPTVTVRNKGVENITAFSVSYRVNNGAIQTSNFIGQNIPRNGEVTVSLVAASLSLSAGSHSIQAFTFNPVTTSGSGDQYLLNDTLSRSFSVIGTANAPLTEDFTNAAFPPTGWGIVNVNNDLAWSRSNIGNNNPGSAFMNNFRNAGRGQIDELHTPDINYAGIDSLLLSFDLSAATRLYPGSQQLPLDTLEILVTTNCGNTYKSVYKKWGIELQTINSPNNPLTVEFFPQDGTQWRTEIVDLTSFTPNGPLQIVFRNKNGFGNNIFVDNVNLRTRILPASLKVDGIQIFPSPFQNTFQIWHLQTPSNLRYINIYNSAGQRVWSKQYNNDALKIIDVDLSRNAAGIYIVELAYNDNQGNLDKNKNQQIRIVKTE